MIFLFPSMVIAQFSYGSPKDKLTAAQSLERGAKLYSRPVEGTQCRLRTAYDVDLVPLEIESAVLESPAPKDGRGMFSESHIRLSVRCFGDANLHEFKIGGKQEVPESLRFYINGDPQLIYSLYEMIFNNASAVEFRPRDTPIGNKTFATLTNIQLKMPDPVILPAAEAIKQVGFKDDEAVLPYTKRSFPGYRLLTEYFAFPYKFMFFDVFGLDKAIGNKFGSHFDILIHLKNITPPQVPITKDTFRLGCSPIVNLFSRTADPIYLSNKKYEYHIIPDVHRQKTTEIYSIDEVYTTDPRTNETREFASFYSMRHAYGEEMEKAFWYANRRPSQRADNDGTEMFMAMVDMDFNPNVPSAEVITVKATCSNRDLPAKLPFGGRTGDFEIEEAAILSGVRCLTKPTETIRLPHRRALQWQLISHLNLNYLSLINSPNGTPEALQEILQLYNYNDSSAARKQIPGITDIEAKKVIGELANTSARVSCAESKRL